jgi:CRP-like cAMP-binding protein
LVSKGDQADAIYYLVDGELEIVGLNKTLKPGAVVGEIGVFAPNQRRTASVVCRTDCDLFELTEHKAKELFFQDRSFSFAVMQLIISRLVENNEHLRQLKTEQTGAPAT